MKTLIVIDMQNDFIDGVLGTKEAVAIVPSVKKKIQEYVDRGDPIIFTMDTHDDRHYLETQEGRLLPVPHCLVNTEGIKIPKEIESLVDNYMGITYLGKGQFGAKDWNAKWITKYIREKSEIEIIGLCTDICVIVNALLLKTYFPENPITVYASCCAGTTPKKHEEALDVMESCQIKVINRKE